MTSMGRASLLVSGSLALLLSAAAGCSSQDNTARMVGGSGPGAGASSGGTNDSGGNTASTSGSSSGGSGGSVATSGGSGGSGSAALPGCMILPVNNPLISEFTPPEATGAGGEGGGASEPVEPEGKISFGYDANPPTVASGFSFHYPQETVTSDISEGVWHLSGSVAEYAGFQIAFVCGADAKAYKGISFKISGSARPTNALTFVVAHASDSWRDPAAAEPTAASCVSANQYDGTCNEASAAVEVTETETTISLMWSDIAGGKPEMNPDPSELLALRWLFKWDEAMSADAAANQYDVDVRLDDLTFIE